MNSVHLVEPDARYRDSYLAALREHQAQGRFLLSRYTNNDIERLADDFSGFVADLQQGRTTGTAIEESFHEKYYWLIDDNEVVGRASLRLTLPQEHVLADLGHIGYDIRPSRQRRGYGYCILGLSLAEARRNGLKRALLSCDDTNIASRKIIEHWGGVFETAIPLAGSPILRRRYWITL